MNELIKQVTPLTIGVIWFVKDETQVSNSHYREIDYLLDGLLTANLKVSAVTTSRVIIGQNFNRPLYVMLIKEAKESEIDSYISLFKKDLSPEHDVVVIDEWDGLKDLKKEFKDIIGNLRTFNA
jgi:hypothetical protein